MGLVIRDTNSPPPERFHYPIAQTGVKVDASNYNQLFDNIHAHCLANNIPEPSRQSVIDYLCRETHVDCYEETTRRPLANKLTMGLPFQAPSCCGKAKA